MITTDHDVTPQVVQFETQARMILSAHGVSDSALPELTKVFDEWAQAWHTQFTVQQQHVKDAQTEAETAYAMLRPAHDSAIRELRRAEILTAQATRYAHLEEGVRNLCGHDDMPAELSDALRGMLSRPAPPVPKGPRPLAPPMPDMRYRSGTFIDPTGALSEYPVIGWVLMADDSGETPAIQLAFRVHGRGYSQTEMKRHLRATLRTLHTWTDAAL